MQFKITRNILNKTKITEIVEALSLGHSELSLIYSSAGCPESTLPPLFFQKYRLYMITPHIISVSSSFFIELFHPLLWTTIIIFYLACLGFLFLYKILHKLNFNQYIESSFHIIRVSEEQIRFSTYSLRCCILCSSILFYILSVYFTAFLTTKLAIIEKTELPFSHIEDLRGQSRYKLCIYPNSVIHKIYSDMNEYKHILNHQDCDYIINNIIHDRSLSRFEQHFCDNPHLTIMMPTRFANILKLQSW